MAAMPDQVRGYGPVKLTAVAKFDAAKEGLLGKISRGAFHSNF